VGPRYMVVLLAVLCPPLFANNWLLASTFMARSQRHKVGLESPRGIPPRQNTANPNIHSSSRGMRTDSPSRLLQIHPLLHSMSILSYFPSAIIYVPHPVPLSQHDHSLFFHLHSQFPHDICDLGSCHHGHIQINLPTRNSHGPTVSTTKTIMTTERTHATCFSLKIVKIEIELSIAFPSKCMRVSCPPAPHLAKNEAVHHQILRYLSYYSNIFMYKHSR
jgi:hypothetical protein